MSNSCADIVSDENYALINHVIKLKDDSNDDTVNTDEKQLMIKLIDLYDQFIKSCDSPTDKTTTNENDVKQFSKIKQQVVEIISKISDKKKEQNKKRENDLNELNNSIDVELQHLRKHSTCPSWKELVVENSSILFDKNRLTSLLHQIKEFSQNLSKYEKHIIDSLNNLIEKYKKNITDKTKFRNEVSERISNLLDKYTHKNFDFLAKTIRNNLNYLNKWRNDKNLNEHLSPYRNEINQVENNLNRLRHRVSKFLNDTFSTTVHERLKGEKTLLDEINKYIQKTNEQIVEYYNNGSIKISDIVLDKEFVFTYFLKFLNICAFTTALYFSEMMFSKLYFKQKYVNLTGQPNLLYLILMMISFTFGFFIFILLLMLVIKFITQTYDKDIFFINDHLFSSYLIDISLTVLLFSILALILAYFMQHKRYFRYKIEGLYTIEGLRDMLLYLVVIINILPLFFINW